MSKDKIKLYDAQISENPNSGISYFLKAKELEKLWQETKDISYNEQAKSCYDEAMRLGPDRVEWLMIKIKFHISVNESELASVQKTIAKLLESEDSRLEDFKQTENQQINEQELSTINGLVEEFY